MRKKQAIIIGSGFGGLAIAIRLQARGYNTLVLEKNSTPGGHAGQLKKNGYTFDLGPSIVTEPEIIEDVFKIAGKKMSDYFELIALDPFYKIFFHDKTSFDYSGDPIKMKLQLAKFSKADSQNYDKFMNYTSKLYKAVITEGLGSKPFYKIKDFLTFIPRIIWLRAFLPCYLTTTVFFRDFKTRFIFSFHTLFIGGNPFRAPGLFLMLPYLERKKGVWFIKGGMYKLVEAFVQILREIGGDIKFNSEVNEIVVDAGKVSGVRVNEKFYPADLVISNAHFAHTYKDLIPENKRRIWTDKKILAKKYSMSCFLIYIGVKKQYPQFIHHTLILSQRYKELITDIFDRHILPEDFSMYLHIPTRTDPTMAPVGSDSMYLLIPVTNLLGEIDWNREKERYANEIIDFIETKFKLKDFRSSIEVLELFTPLDFKEQRNNHLGAAWSLEPELFQIANFRPHNQSEEYKNLYLVGASTHPGGGLPGVLLGAEATEKLILGST